MRGPRPLDRERNSSHVLIVEAYNHDLGPMRSSVRVRRGCSGWAGGWWGCTRGQLSVKPCALFSADLRAGPRPQVGQSWPPGGTRWGQGHP